MSVKGEFKERKGRGTKARKKEGKGVRGGGLIYKRGEKSKKKEGNLFRVWVSVYIGCRSRIIMASYKQGYMERG